jgi:hypothetical protein
VNPFVDALMLILFVFFMLFIFRGYHTQRLEKLEEEEAEQEKRAEEKEAEKKDS